MTNFILEGGREGIPLLWESSVHLTFPQGLFGFPGIMHYTLAPLPNIPLNRGFFVLRSEDSEQARFVVRFLFDQDPLFNHINMKKLHKEVEYLPLFDAKLSLALMTMAYPRDNVLLFHFEAPLVFDFDTKTGFQLVLI